MLNDEVLDVGEKTYDGVQTQLQRQEWRKYEVFIVPGNGQIELLQ
jgi:hypothetical protein